MILSSTIMHIHLALNFSVGLGPAAFPRGRWPSGYVPAAQRRTRAGGTKGQLFTGAIRELLSSYAVLFHWQ